MRSPNKKALFRFAAVPLLLALGSCAELNDPNYGSSYPAGGYYPTGGGYGSGQAPYNSGYRDPYSGRTYDNRYENERRRLEYERERAREERERAEEAREDAERARRRYERERERDREHRRVQSNTMRPSPPPPPPPAEERCPSGYNETNRKCTDAERKRGCSDIKMQSGKRCIRL